MIRMTKTLTLRDANQTFARCILKVEAGEEFVIARGAAPVARLSRFRRDNDVRAAIADILAVRVGQAAEQGGRAPGRARREPAQLMGEG